MPTWNEENSVRSEEDLSQLTAHMEGMQEDFVVLALKAVKEQSQAALTSSERGRKRA